MREMNTHEDPPEVRLTQEDWDEAVREEMWTLIDQNGRVCPGCGRDFRVQSEGLRWHIRVECDELRTLAETEVREVYGAPQHD